MTESLAGWIIVGSLFSSLLIHSAIEAVCKWARRRRRVCKGRLR